MFMFNILTRNLLHSVTAQSFLGEPYFWYLLQHLQSSSAYILDGNPAACWLH